jgi:hypothetical protein
MTGMTLVLPDLPDRCTLVLPDRWICRTVAPWYLGAAAGHRDHHHLLRLGHGQMMDDSTQLAHS